MRVAAIDVGTNSIHLVVAEVSPDGDITLVEKAREQVELGSGGLGRRRIVPEAFERGLAALESFRSAADSIGVVDITAAATSAVREAENGSDFCHAVRDRTGIHVRTITGTEEARLIWLGARASLDFSKGRVLLCDLGGGSTEFILCDPESTLLIESLPVGHIRLTDTLVHGLPLSRADRETLAHTCRQRLERLTRRLGPEDFGTLVGTSGAIRCLARMATLARGDQPPEHGQGLLLSRTEIDHFLARFSELNEDKIAALPGMDARRSRTLPAAALWLGEILRALGKSRIITSEHSLRDGLVVDWVLRHRPEIKLSRTITDPRRRSVLTVMRRYHVDQAHAQHVARLALKLFDTTAELHGLRVDDRRMLEFAALLHDVGHHISGLGHNRHSQYLIRHTRMLGFTSPEIDILGCVARYHRGSRPKRSHPEYAALSPLDQRRVSVLAGLLRVADALDRGHGQAVTELQLHLDDETLSIHAWAREGGDIERWAARRRMALLGQCLGRSIEVSVGPAPA